MDGSAGTDRDLGRVGYISDNRREAHVEIVRNSKWVTISHDRPLDLTLGSLIFVDLDSGRTDMAPKDLWVDAAPVGNVRFKSSKETVVEVGGRQIAIPTVASPPYEVDNSVKFSERLGVLSVLSDRAIAGLDPADEDSVNVDRFRSDGDGTLEFSDFGGSPDVVDRARQLVELPLLHAEALERINAKPIKGVLFSGPPGTGKTFLARIIASQAKAAVYQISGPRISSKWVGQSERLLRSIFEDAASRSRALIVFDEIDSMAGQRGEKSHEASDKLVAQLLAEMDGFEQRRGIMVVGTTNRIGSIDTALRRPGRFDWEIEFSLPTAADRADILRRSGEDIRKLSEIAHEEVASMTEGWSAADLVYIWSEAALVAVQNGGRDSISQEDYFEGFRRAQVQKELRSRSFPPDNGS